MPFFLTFPSALGLRQKTQITSRCFPHLLFLTAVGVGTILWATTLNRARGVVRQAVFLVGTASPRLSLIWLLRLCRWLPPRPLPARSYPAEVAGGHRDRRWLRGRRASPLRFWPLLFLPDLSKQLHRSSQASAVFNFEADEISIVQACTHPAFPRQSIKANPLLPFKT